MGEKVKRGGGKKRLLATLATTDSKPASMLNCPGEWHKKISVFTQPFFERTGKPDLLVEGKGAEVRP